MGKARSKKVLVIGWDAADWKVIEPLMQEGKMPALKRLMESGVYGRIQTLDPPLSPMLWTSIATGFRADIHGIDGFVEPLPDGTGLRPVTSTSRKVKAIWNILNQEGKKSNVVAWWPSNPVEPINGVMVSNLYQVPTKPIDEEWPMMDGTIHPKEMEEELKQFRVHPLEITLKMAVQFIPNLATNKELRKEKLTFGMMKVLANAASVHAASTHLMENTEWDFMAVYHDAIDHFCHLAMKYHPPYRPEIPEEDYNNYKEIVESGYRFHDMMLDRTLDLIDEDTTVILLSDHGFHSDHQRPLYIPKEPSGPAFEHSPYGIVVMSGPGIKKGGMEISGSSVIDITPTLLALYGLPVGKDMEGKVLYQAFEDTTAVDFIESWEKVDGDSGMHDKNVQEDPWAAQEALKQLVELGYIDPMDDDIAEQVVKARRESDYYIARNMIDGGRVKPALEILERIFEESKISRYGQRLVYAYLSQGQYQQCQNLIEELRTIEKQELKRIKEEKKNAKDEQDKDLGELHPVLWDENVEEPMYLDYLQGLLYLAMNKPWLALPLLEKVQKKNNTNADVPFNIGKILNQRKKYQMAEKYFIKSLAIDDRNARTHYGLGLSYLRRNKLELALDELLTSVNLNFYVPGFHYHLGETLVRLEDFENAAQAFEVAIRFMPGMTKAHQWLHDIYKNKLHLPEKAEEHELFIQKNIRGEMVIVTGLPKSGAAKVLNMLENGGQEVLFGKLDQEEDVLIGGEENLDMIRRLSTDEQFKADSRDKAAKVFIQHLSNLPADLNYKVIRVIRPIDDIIFDQKKVVQKLKKQELPMDIVAKLEARLNLFNEWTRSRPNIWVLDLEYNDLVEHPLDCAGVISTFLGKDLDVKEMEKAFEK